MLAVWMRFRNAAPLKESSFNGKLIADWLPKGVTVHDVAANLMLMTLVAGCFMAQMAVHAAKRKDNVHVGWPKGVATLFALAVINACGPSSTARWPCRSGAGSTTRCSTHHALCSWC
ncbi:MAG: hypothetical protein R2705_23265 [Ilumatobacteraceae bacterium]